MIRKIIIMSAALLILAIAFFWVAKRIAWAPSLLGEREKGGNECRITGCSGQICAESDIITSCEVLPVYGCYKTAHCERQVDGDCGWTESEELMRCIEESRISEKPL